MKNLVFIAFLIYLFFDTHILFAQGDGKLLFRKNCAACHTVNRGRLVGPDLANVHQRRPKEWILRFVKSSQSVIQSGDTYAVELFKKYKDVKMPNHTLSDNEILSILDYIISKSPAVAASDAKVEMVVDQGKPLSEATKKDILKGQALFVGKTRLELKGPACNSCHHVKNNAIMAGGSLAKNLTTAFSRLSEAGVKANVSYPSSAIMRQAFEDRPLTEDEVFYLAAFLQYADKESFYQLPKNYQKTLLYSGFGGVLVLFGLFSVFWFNRKRSSVNQRIYERQISSS